MSKTNDELERENAQLKEQLRRRDYKFGEAAQNLAQHIEGDPERLRGLRRRRRNQETEEGGDE